MLLAVGPAAGGTSPVSVNRLGVGIAVANQGQAQEASRDREEQQHGIADMVAHTALPTKTQHTNNGGWVENAEVVVTI